MERFNLTMRVEWLYARPYGGDDHRTAELAAFLNTYNHERCPGNKPTASTVPITTYRG